VAPIQEMLPLEDDMEAFNNSAKNTFIYPIYLYFYDPLKSLISILSLCRYDTSFYDMPSFSIEKYF
jgi:hypothetical protein